MAVKDLQARNQNIDILRAVAILLVMVVHFPRLRQIFPFLNPWSGVDLFFAISGYVVAKSFVPRLDQALVSSSADAGRHAIIARHIKAFFVRRFMRIMPALCFAVVFYLGVGFSIGEPNLGSTGDLFREIFAIFTYTENFYAAYQGQTALTWHWSLAAEEQFYFIFPFFIALVPRTKTRVWITLGCIALVTFILRPYGTNWFGNAPAAMYLPQFRNDALAYGFLVFIAQEQSWFRSLAPRAILNNYLLISCALVALIATVALAPQMAFSFNVAIPIIGIASSILLLLALWSTRPLLGFKPISIALNWIGLRSYGIYLLHVPIVRIIQQIEIKYFSAAEPISYPAHLLGTIISLYIIVELSYQLIEKPMMRIGKKWSKEILDPTLDQSA